MILNALEKVKAAVTKTLRDRVQAVLEASVKNDVNVVNENLALAKSELAAALGVSRPTLNAAMDELIASGELEGIIQKGNRYLLDLEHCHLIADHMKIKSWNDSVGSKHIIVDVNMKGGTGKSTVSVNMAAGLSYGMTERKRCLLIDLDPQGSDRNFSQPDMEKSKDILTAVDLMLADYEKDEDYNDYHKFVERVGHKALVKMSCQPTQYPNMDILASFPLDDRFNQFVFEHFKDDYMSAMSLLKERVIDQIIDDYDLIFIDCPPSMGPIVWSALEAATGIIVPVTPKNLDWMATVTFFQQLPKRLAQLPSKGENLQWFKILLNNVDQEHSRDSVMVSEIQNAVGAENMFLRVIDRSTAFEVASQNFRTVIDIRPKDDLVNPKQLSNAKDCINNVCRELVSILKSHPGV